MAGQAQGVVATTRGRVTSQPVAGDDETVRQRILSDALRDVPVSTKEIDVHVHGGVATLRGSVESESLVDALVRRVSETPGVVDVKPELEVAS
jgi:osmotically-inducible protein OsmY